MLGSFAWRIVPIDKESVVVSQTSADGVRHPFWKGETKGRSLKTGLAFGRMFSWLEKAEKQERLEEVLQEPGLDEAAVSSAAGFLRRQIGQRSAFSFGTIRGKSLDDGHEAGRAPAVMNAEAPGYGDVQLHNR